MKIDTREIRQRERKLKIYTLVYDEGKTDAMIRITA